MCPNIMCQQDHLKMDTSRHFNAKVTVESLASADFPLEGSTETHRRLASLSSWQSISLQAMVCFSVSWTRRKHFLCLTKGAVCTISPMQLLSRRQSRMVCQQFPAKTRVPWTFILLPLCRSTSNMVQCVEGGQSGRPVGNPCSEHIPVDATENSIQLTESCWISPHRHQHATSALLTMRKDWDLLDKRTMCKHDHHHVFVFLRFLNVRKKKSLKS